MERSRDGKRGSVTAGNGLSRRRARSSGLRVSPGDHSAAQSGGKKDRDRDRDRDRSGRSKRRRGDRMMPGSNRDEGEDSSDESLDEEEEDEDDEERTAVLLPPLPSNLSPPLGVPPRTAKSPPVWRAADEMIAVSVPRKARSGSSGNGGAGEQLHRQASTSPSRQIHAAAAPAPTSPSFSNASVRKRMKPVGGPKPRPTKVAKSPSSIQEIEIEVAEVLYGLTRQFQDPANKHDSKDTNGCVKDSKCRVLSPSSASAAPGIPKSSLLPPQNSSISTAPLPAHQNGRDRGRLSLKKSTLQVLPFNLRFQSPMPERGSHDAAETKEETPSGDSPREKLKIDLMKQIPQYMRCVASLAIFNSVVWLDTWFLTVIMCCLFSQARKLRPVKGSNLEMGEIRGEEKTDESLMELGSRKPPVKERRPLDPPLDIQGLRQQSEAPGAGSKPEKTIPHPSLALPMPVAGLPGTLPFGCMSQIPSLQALMPMDGRSSPYKATQPPHLLPQQLRPKHCSTHCYIAKNIQYHQHIARLGPFWPAAAAAGVASLYGAKPSNPSAAPSPEEAASSAAFPSGNNKQHAACPSIHISSQSATSSGSSSSHCIPNSTYVNPSAVSFNYSNLPHGEAQYVVLQNGGYPFPIPAHIGATYRGEATPNHYPSSMAPSMPPSDKQHHEPPPPQSHQHQLQLQQQSMKAAELNSAQAFAMSFAAMNGPNGSRHTGLDLPSKGQHQTIFQSLPPEAASQKKAQYQQSGDGKSMGDPITGGALSAGEDRKTAQAGGKTSSSVSHQSVAFSRTEVDPSSATLCINPAAAAAAGIKGLPPPSLLQAAQFAATSGAHTLMSAAGFPYLHAMPSVPVKPAEHKPAAGGMVEGPTDGQLAIHLVCR
ncbi:unnamed protein product [Spirodela intermedia]|uniref:Uncharacterized protein n=1 Tax=Spirodela intermedia TaxID=51605 RepID=A0A7I8I9P6_SPIIN|nr:unnamed protein product [Spirodela intermedia]CAA6653651.1 unnamed protein product [Spirodela intermedia]